MANTAPMIDAGWRNSGRLNESLDRRCPLALLQRGEIGDEDVVHVRAVVHDEDDARVVGDPREPFVVRVPHPNAVERPRDAARDEIPGAEVRVRAERRDDLVGVPPDPRVHHLARGPADARVRRDRLEELGVMREPVDQDLAPRRLERIEPQVQVNVHKRMPWIEQLFGKPTVEQGVDEAEITSYQHPDHDTQVWPPEDERA